MGKNMGRREAKKQELDARPALIMKALHKGPMAAADIATVIGMSPGKPAGRLLTQLLRQGKVRYKQIGMGGLWAAVGSPADEALRQLEELRAIEAKKARVARDRARKAKPDAVKEAELQKWLIPTKRLVPAGKWRPHVPAGAVRSVFELGARA